MDNEITSNPSRNYLTSFVTLLYKQTGIMLSRLELVHLRPSLVLSLQVLCRSWLIALLAFMHVIANIISALYGVITKTR